MQYLSNSCFASFQTKSSIFDNSILYANFQRVSMPAQDRGYLIVISGTPLTTNQKRTWRDPLPFKSINKESRRPGKNIIMSAFKIIVHYLSFWEDFNPNIIIHRIPCCVGYFGDGEVSLFDRKTRWAAVAGART